MLKFYKYIFTFADEIIDKSMDRKGLFIAFEGIDGSGKSTQVKLLEQYLKELGHKVYATFEPTDSLIGKIIRDIRKFSIPYPKIIISN